jgi:predicted nucleotidyltransferase
MGEFNGHTGQRNHIKPSEALALHRDDVLRILAAAGALNPRVFGSVARGDDTEDSDLDLWIDPAPGFSLFDLGGLTVELEELLGVPVDIGTGFRNQRIEDEVRRDARPL